MRLFKARHSGCHHQTARPNLRTCATGAQWHDGMTIGCLDQSSWPRAFTVLRFNQARATDGKISPCVRGAPTLSASISNCLTCWSLCTERVLFTYAKAADGPRSLRYPAKSLLCLPDRPELFVEAESSESPLLICRWSGWKAYSGPVRRAVGFLRREYDSASSIRSSLQRSPPWRGSFMRLASAVHSMRIHWPTLWQSI
jgi:hypothetical protein